MRQFFAILRDSFRESVDGFVIYAMLVMSVLVIVLIGSLSFVPSEPDEAFKDITRHFGDGVIQGGRLSGFIASQYANFTSQDVRAEAKGYRALVVVTGQPFSADNPFGPGGPMRGRGRAKTGNAEQDGDNPKAETKAAKGEVGLDGFRRLVLLWEREGKEKNDLPLFRPMTATDVELRSVSDAQMEEYIKAQFAFHAGLDATVTRVRDGAAEPEYRFEVMTSGGSAVRGWPHKVTILFGVWTFPVPFNLGETLFWLEDRLVNGFGAALALLISVVITAFFIPNLLRKGSIDLLISKPIGRTQLLIYKYVGGLTFIFLITSITVGGVWVVLAARSGIWEPTFLIVIPVLTFTFAILYSVSTFVAVFTRSPIVAILLSVGFAVFLYIVGQIKSVFDTFRGDKMVGREIPEWAYTLVDTINNILPRYKDLDKLTTKLLSAGTLTPAEMRERALDALQYPSWGATLGVSFAFIAVMLALSSWRFSRRDY